MSVGRVELKILLDAAPLSAALEAIHMPSEPCPHANKGERVDESGRVQVYCRDCNRPLYYR